MADPNGGPLASIIINAAKLWCGVKRIFTKKK